VTAQIEHKDGEDSGNEGIEKGVPNESIWQNHFEDAEKMTTVTVIEDFEQIGLENFDGSGTNEEKPAISSTTPSMASEPQISKKKPESKKKAFRYGTKAERKSDRQKAKLKKVRNKSKRKLK
jgi:hypothetical protein